ncbi:MAG: NAD/NADP octopine/nopaline dehydrogenase family protein [bacterium]
MRQIGIYGASGQSGKAFFADLLAMNVNVYGYARPSKHGQAEVDAVHRQGGIIREQPEGPDAVSSQLIPTRPDQYGHDLDRLAESSMIIFSHPSVYHEATARELKPLLRAQRQRVPLVLSPSRTMGTPYLWQILGRDYPVVAFQTCPYACKTFRPGAVFVKQRKRAWLASIEGDTPRYTISTLKQLFPQIVMSRTAATTSLGNIGAVFHPAAYLLNLPAIEAARAAGRDFSFYMEGIAHNPEVGAVVGRIDQTRLRIARALGCSVFGLDEDPREEEWSAIMERVWRLSNTEGLDPRDKVKLTGRYLKPIHNSVVSAQHWLAYTYGVRRVRGESLASAIGRTPNYQAKSFPQERYAHEDVPAGLVPLESLARRLDIEHGDISHAIDLYNEMAGVDARKTGRNLNGFSTEYLRWYLLDGNSRVRTNRWQRAAS